MASYCILLRNRAFSSIKNCTCLGHFTAFHHQLTTVGFICDERARLEIKCYFLKLISSSYDVPVLVISDERKMEEEKKN